MTETREPAETGGYASLEEDDEDLSPGEAPFQVAVRSSFKVGGWLRNLEEWLLVLPEVLF